LGPATSQPVREVELLAHALPTISRGKDPFTAGATTTFAYRTGTFWGGLFNTLQLAVPAPCAGPTTPVLRPVWLGYFVQKDLIHFAYGAITLYDPAFQQIQL
jgi:hypothetical protein